jgi:hypothetical protein
VVGALIQTLDARKHMRKPAFYKALCVQEDDGRCFNHHLSSREVFHRRHAPTQAWEVLDGKLGGNAHISAPRLKSLASQSFRWIRDESRSLGREVGIENVGKCLVHFLEQPLSALSFCFVLCIIGADELPKVVERSDLVSNTHTRTLAGIGILVDKDDLINYQLLII